MSKSLIKCSKKSLPYKSTFHYYSCVFSLKKNILKMDCLRSLQADDLPHRMWNPTATCVFKTLTGQFTVLQFCGTLSYPIPSILIAMDLIYSSRYLLLAIRRTTMQQCLKTLSRPIGNKTFFV